MTNYAIIEIGTKQYKVQVGEILEVQKLADARGEMEFDKVLLTKDGDSIVVGSPYIKDVKVYATFIEDKKGEKLDVFKYKSKSKYRKMRGSRQTYSYLKIDSIGTTKPSKVEEKEVKPKAKATPSPKKKPAVKK